MNVAHGEYYQHLVSFLIFTIVAAYIYMPPTLLKEFSQSLVSVSAFISNVFFFLESGYFSSASDEMPLLHTWSLAVEEQYYVIFPLVVGLFWVRSKKAFIAGVLIISLISLAISQYLANQGQADLNFYLIQSRAWELLFGSMIALFSLDGEKTDVKLRELLSIGGMAMIIYSIVFSIKIPRFQAFMHLSLWWGPVWLSYIHVQIRLSDTCLQASYSSLSV